MCWIDTPLTRDTAGMCVNRDGSGSGKHIDPVVIIQGENWLYAAGDCDCSVR